MHFFRCNVISFSSLYLWKMRLFTHLCGRRSYTAPKHKRLLSRCSAVPARRLGSVCLDTGYVQPHLRANNAAGFSHSCLSAASTVVRTWEKSTWNFNKSNPSRLVHFLISSARHVEVVHGPSNVKGLNLRSRSGPGRNGVTLADMTLCVPFVAVSICRNALGPHLLSTSNRRCCFSSAANNSAGENRLPGLIPDGKLSSTANLSAMPTGFSRD